MNTSVNNFDAIEKLIFEEGLRIEAVDIHPELDVMLIILNTKAVLHQRLSAYTKLLNASKKDLLNYNLVGGGTGLHWAALDEDLSLKGFLQDELRSIVSSRNDAAA
jgi:hypothetical protein